MRWETGDSKKAPPQKKVDELALSSNGGKTASIQESIKNTEQSGPKSILGEGRQSTKFLGWTGAACSGFRGCVTA